MNLGMSASSIVERLPILLVFAVWLGLGCGDSAPPSGSEATRTEQPNILMLIGDDHGYPYFGFTGS